MDQELSITVKDLSELPSVAKKILDFGGKARIFLFDAPMGAGKTTIIKTLCEQLGSRDNFGSPTYSIINEYKYPGGRIFHFDLYRLKDPSELLDLGIEEYLDSGHYCFIEWPEKVMELLEDEYVQISIRNDENSRYIVASHKHH